MRVQWAVACSCIAIVVIHTGAKAADRDMPPAAVGSAVSVPSLTSESAFADYQPFRDEKLRSWKDANQVVADNPGMGSMGAMKGMAGMESRSASGSDDKEGARGQDMAAMKAVPGMAMESGKAAGVGAGAPGHDMGAMKGMPGMRKPAESPVQQSPSEMAMTKSQATATRPDSAAASAVIGTATVQGVDKANSRVKLAHDPIAALGWPKMTMFFKLKDGALADRIKAGDSIEFSLEKSTSGYVISDMKKRTHGR